MLLSLFEELKEKEMATHSSVLAGKRDSCREKEALLSLEEQATRMCDT